MNKRFEILICIILVIGLSIFGYNSFGVIGCVFMFVISSVAAGFAIFNASMKNSVYIKSRTPFYLETSLDKKLIEKTIKTFLTERNFHETNYMTGEIVYSFKNSFFENKKYIAYHFDQNILVFETWISKGGKEETPVDFDYHDKSDKHFVKKTVEELIDKLANLDKNTQDNK